MHVPDGFLDARTAVASGALAAAGVGIALRHAQRHIPRHEVPLLGITAAFIFAAQMLNFPVAGGTSGHLIGAALAAVLLGPAAAVIVMTTVLVVQCFLFADGGLTALGANVFNMAIVSVLAGHVAYRLVRRLDPGPRGTIAGAAFAGWCATVCAAVPCAGELALAGTTPWSAVFPAMTAVHMLIGLGEGLITALVLVAVVEARPHLAGAKTRAGSSAWGPVVALGLIVALGLVVFVAPFASPWPDGLERVASHLGFEHRSLAPPITALLPDYEFPGIGSPVAAVAAAGVVGTLIVLLLSWALAELLVRRRAERET